MKEINDKAIETTTEKILYPNAKVKELLAKPDIQAAMRNHIDVPQFLIVKKVGKPSTEHHTQRVEGIAGTSIENAVAINFTILDESHRIFIDPVKSINKKYRIIDYTLGLDANMSGKSFQGYSATGLKLIVTKIEEVKGK